MRFHFGFSKFIKPSKLLYWLGLGFLIILGYFGVVDNAFASSLYDATNVNLGSYITSFSVVNYSKTTLSGPFGNPENYSENISWGNRDYANVGWKANNIANASYYTIFSHLDYEISTNMCSNVNGARSLDLYFQFSGRSLNYINTWLNEVNIAPTDTISDVLGVGITPIFSGDGPFAEYSCNINDYDDITGRWSVACIGIPTENVLSYQISFYNNLFYTNDLEQLNFTTGSSQPNALNSIRRIFDYSCSDVEPVRPDQPLFPDDITGSSNINISSGSSGGVTFDTNGSMDYSYIELAYPNTLTQFIEFPLYIANVLINNHDTCTPITIDFSSIVRRWGGGNNSSYYLTFPCLGTTIYDIFNVPIFGESVSLYTLIDMFIAFVLLYMLATRMVVLINMLMSGEDMVGYLYSGTETASVDSSTGVVSKRRRRY